MSGGSYDVVMVTYESGDFMGPVADSLAGERLVRNIVIVDHSPSESTAAAISEITTWPTPPTVIRDKSNPGFGEGMNRGARSIDNPSDHLVLMNPDVVVRPAQIAELIGELEVSRHHAVVGARLSRPDGSPVASARMFPSRASLIRLNARDISSRRSCTVDWVCGALMVWSRDWFDRVGGFDERYFLYYEDTDICRAVKDLGGSSRYMPTVNILHDQGHGNETSPLLRRASRKSKLLYARKWLGLSGLIAGATGNVHERVRAQIKGRFRS